MSENLKNWKPRPRPERKVMEGRLVRLEPLGPGTHAVIETPAGTFAGRDHRLTVTAAA